MINIWNFKDRDIEGNTPLLICCRKGALSTIQALYSSLPSFNVRECNKYGSTMILEACKSGNIDLVNWLSEHGSQFDERNIFGDTCLLFAAFKGHMELVQWLLNHGSSISERNFAENTCL